MSDIDKFIDVSKSYKYVGFVAHMGILDNLILGEHTLTIYRGNLEVVVTQKGDPFYQPLRPGWYYFESSRPLETLSLRTSGFDGTFMGLDSYEDILLAPNKHELGKSHEALTSPRASDGKEVAAQPAELESSKE